MRRFRPCRVFTLPCHRLAKSAFTFFMVMLTMFSPLVTHGAPAPAGSVITNTAEFSYGYNSTTADTISNSVQVVVQQSESLTLTQDQTIQATAGSTVSLVHHLTNTGNSTSTYNLSLINLLGDDFDMEALTLYRNMDNSGTVAASDPVIAGGGTITLSQGETATLIIQGTLPATGNTGSGASIELTAESQDQQAADSNTDTVTFLAVTPPPTISFYTDNTYSTATIISPLSSPLYLQVHAEQCNTDPLTAESRLVTIVSSLTGDTETFTAVETGPDTGYFRILPNVPAQDGSIYPVVHENGVVETLSNDQLTASIDGCGSATVTTNIFIDPEGVVFDTATNAPVAGAVVTIMNVSSGTPQPALVYNYDGTPLANSITTGSNGVFRFPLLNPGTYQLQITPPNGYALSEVKGPPSPWPSRNITYDASFGGTFEVSGDTGTVRFDVPLDPAAASGLFVEKSASVSTAELGDFVDYTIKVKNGSGILLKDVALNDRLPAGFSYESGTTRIDRTKTANPEGGKGPRISFSLGDMAANATVTLTYRVKVGPGAFEGDGINRAQAHDAVGTASNVASARVRVLGGVFSDKGFIVGKVFTDCNRNRVQDPEEVGIPGVRLYLEDGTFVITDGEGKYSLYNISPRTHVLKLDPITLPAGAELMELSSRNAGDAGSLFIDMKSGELHKANFAEGSCNEQVMAEIKERRGKSEEAGSESERTLTRNLSFDVSTPSRADVKGLPASGIVGSSTSTEPKDIIHSPEAREVASPSQPLAEKAAQPTLEELVATADKTLAFLNLSDNQVLPLAQTAIMVKGPSGITLKLLLNGEEVPASRLGKKLTEGKKALEAREYIGIDLKPGPNRLQLLAVDPFGNMRGETVVTVIAPGKLAKVSVSIPETEFVADGVTPLPVTVRLDDENSLPFAAPTTVTLDSTLGHWEAKDLDDKTPGTQVSMEGGTAQFRLLPPAEPGETVLKVSAGTLTEESRAYFYPNLRPLVAAGLVEGTINFRNIGSGALVPARDEDGFEKELRAESFSSDNGKVQGGARTALFLKGKVKGDYLLTLSYDTDKDTRDTLFRDIQPDQFYPVYGDSSVKGFEAQSTNKLYVRIDKNKSYLLYGDYIGSEGGKARVLGAYSRSLSGVKGHYENSSVSANVFASRDTSTQMVEEIAAQGISGPYYLKNSGYVANSEKVEIITRDRNQPSLVLKTVAQSRFTDYEIEELSGRILFKAPIPSLDQDMNPNYIRVTYEVDQGGNPYWVAGGDAQVKLHPRLEIGGSYVNDDNPENHWELSSANFVLKLLEKTYLVAETARTWSDIIGSGTANRFELVHEGERLQARIHGVRTDDSFDNSSSTLGKGRTEAGVKATYKLSESTTIAVEALHSEDNVNSGTKDGILATLQQTLSKLLRMELGIRHSRETATPSQEASTGATPLEFTSLRGKLTGQVPQLSGLTLSGEYEQALEQSDRRVAAVGAEYPIAGKGKLYARHEFISSLTGDYSLNGSQRQNATLIGVDTEYMKDGKVFSEYRVRDAVAGRDSEAAIGLRNGWTLAEGVRLNTTFEQVQALGANTDSTATAVTAALEYTASPRLKGTGRLEFRFANSSNTVLNTLGMAYKLNRNFTLLGRQYLSITDNKGETGDKIQERFQLGTAYRPTDRDDWNALLRYEFKYEDDESSADSSSKRTVHILSTHLNYQPAGDLTLSGRYAGKLLTDESNGFTSRSVTQLLSGRMIYDVTSRVDLGLTGSALFSDFFGSCRYGVGMEAGYLVAANLWLSAGYNVTGFSDKDLAEEEYTSQGVYVRLRFKFDEDLFSGKNPKANKTIPLAMN